MTFKTMLSVRSENRSGSHSLWAYQPLHIPTSTIGQMSPGMSYVAAKLDKLHTITRKSEKCMSGYIY